MGIYKANARTYWQIFVLICGNEQNMFFATELQKLSCIFAHSKKNSKKMKIKTLLITICMIMAGGSLFAQHHDHDHFAITGTVTDATTKEKLPYVAVALLQPKDSSIVNGGITNEEGVFKIGDVHPDNYILQYSFVGYKNAYKNVSIDAKHADVGNVELKISSENLQEVKVVGAKQMMEYKLDKRVLNVDQNLVATGGTASDVLENVPSVEVDEDGNITLRGGSNVTLLIDGKPSDLYGSDVAGVLAQIPASSIDKVEVITNPSARYNPEGMSGIINIALKEKGNRGWNGNVNIASGSALNKWMPYENISAALNYSNKKFAFNSSASFHYVEHGNLTDNMRYFKDNNNEITDIMRTQRDGGTKSLGYNLLLGGEWYINKHNTLSFTFNTHTHHELSDYSTATNTNLVDPLSVRNNVDISDGTGMNSHNNVNLTYEKTFDRPDELFYASFTWNWGVHDRSIQDSIKYGNPIYPSYVRGDTTSANPNNAVVDIHYVYPFSEKSKLEVGYNLNYRVGHPNYEYSYDHILDSTTSYNFNREEQIHAIYATYGFQIGKKLSAQLGLRGEMVKLNFERDLYKGGKTEYNRDYNSIYPTLHVSYQLNEMNSFQLSYSRRVKRPDHWNIMPNIDHTNQEYLRMGNPKLDPEYTDAFELGYSLMFKNTTIYTSLYYRQVQDGINHFDFLWNEENALAYGFDWAWGVAGDDSVSGRTAQTFMNISKGRNYGLELIIDRDITNWWKANLSMNFFGSYQDGRSLNYDEVTSFNYNAKLNTTFSLPKSWTIQVSGRYFAPRTTIQGRMDARYDFDLAIKKSILHNHGNIGINFRDIFDTRGGSGYSYTDEYIQFSNRHPFSRSVRVSFTYNFGAGSHNHEKGAHKHDHGGASDGSEEEEDQ